MITEIDVRKKEYEEKLFKSVLDSVLNSCGEKYLTSIILTGSFGRDEPTYLLDDKGNAVLKSDIEIALVFPKIKNKKRVEIIANNVSLEYNEDLNFLPMNEKRLKKGLNFNYSLKEPKYKTIFTYDLFNGSKTIWGKDFLSEKKIELKDVDLFEAKRLVANRIGELVWLQNNINNENEIDYLKKQWRGKLMLAIMSAWLLCEGKYSSSYHSQYEAIINNQESLKSCFGETVIDDYKASFLFLRENKNEYEISDNRLMRYVNTINLLFDRKAIKKPKVNSISRVAKYYFKYLKAGMGYGLIGFERRIIQSLIEHFANSNEMINKDADIWHQVLY